MRIAQATDWSWSIWIDLTFLISVFLLSKSKVHQWIWIFIFFDLLLHKLKWLFSRVWTAWKTWRTWRRGSVRRTCRWSSPWMARTWRLPWPPLRQPYYDHNQDNYILIKEDLNLKQPQICIFIPHVIWRTIQNKLCWANICCFVWYVCSNTLHPVSLKALISCCWWWWWWWWW